MTQISRYNLFSRARNYFKSADIPLWFKILNLIILIPVLLCPFVFFTTIFFFDNPKSLFLTFLFFLAVNAYPLYLGLLAFGNYKLYRRNKYLALVLPMIFLLVLVKGTFYILSVKEETFKKTEEAKKEELRMIANGELGAGFKKDKLNVYLLDTLVNNADASTFEVLNWHWQKDKSSYFYRGKPLPGVDYKSFIMLQGNYAKDKNNVYYENAIVQGADPITFNVDDLTYIGKDKSGCYVNGEKADCSQAEERD